MHMLAELSHFSIPVPINVALVLALLPLLLLRLRLRLRGASPSNLHPAAFHHSQSGCCLSISVTPEAWLLRYRLPAGLNSSHCAA